jgi:EAL domain-containing protein (putative c-di-GMP-specific phosphodiesterase class I)
LREALEQGELVVHYQPQVDVATHVTRGVEALIRWRHPVRGVLPASEFIGQAERSGLISQLNRFVLNTGMRQWQRWEEQGIRLELAVNLAGVDLLDAFLPDYISALLQEHGVPPEYLVLEVTERILMHEQQRAMVDRLDRRGITIAIDDYGTGFSSLAALRELPIRQVKIDRRFLVGIPEDERNETIVRSTIQLAHALGATVVAEGVESERQLHRLKEFGCDIAQGYWIGRPLASNKLTALLRTRQVPLAQAGRQEPALTR